MHRRCQWLVVEGCRDDGVGVGARTTAQAPLPEICQKLRYTHPHAAPRSHSWKRLPTCAVVWRRGVLHSVVNHRRIDGMQVVIWSTPTLIGCRCSGPGKRWKRPEGESGGPR